MKMKLLVSMAGAVTHDVGDEIECGDSEAERLIAAGFAVPISPKIERAIKKAPKETRKG